MASSLSSSSSDNRVPSCSKACSKAYAQLHSQYDKLTNDLRKSQFDVLSYQAGLEYVEARLVVYKQNESILEENIQLLKIEVQARDTALVSFRQKLNQAEQEKDDLKLKLDKFQTSFINLTKLLASQTNDKHGLGYVSSEDDSASDRLPPSGGYHVVPPLITGNFMPPKPDLVFHTALIAVETDHSAFTVQLNPAKPAEDLSHTNRPSAPIIEEWVSDSEEDSKTTALQIAHSSVQSTKQVTPPRHFIQPVKAPIPAATPKPTTPKGTHKQNASFTHYHPQMHMVPVVVLSQSKPISTAVRPICAAIMAIKPKHARSLHTNTNSIFRRHKTRSHFSKTSNLSSRVTATKAQRFTAAKGKHCKWIWKPKCPTLNHDFKTTGASLTLERLYYIDAQGRSKSVMAWVPKRF
nr:hypothetical protein [Tanacetum cinerariifolium]